MHYWDPVGIPDRLSLGASAILNLLIVMVTHVTGAGSSSLPYSTLCTTNTCRNGQCYVVGSQAKCVCDVTFRGDRCQNINIDLVTYSIIGTVVVFKWPTPPHLKGYSFVYYKIDSEELLLYKNAIHMNDNDNSVIVGDLQETNTHYEICIEDDIVADRATSSKSTELLTNCMVIETQPDYHTLAGYCIWLFLCATVVLVMYWQRDKIEFLYFHKPTYYYDRPKPEEEGQSEEPETPVQSP